MLPELKEFKVRLDLLVPKDLKARRVNAAHKGFKDF